MARVDLLPCQRRYGRGSARLWRAAGLLALLVSAPATAQQAPAGSTSDAAAREFLRYILSREGQAAVQADGKYLPLTPEAAREQRARLDR